MTMPPLDESDIAKIYERAARESLRARVVEILLQQRLVYRATGGEARVLTSTIQVKAADVVWLVEEVRRLRRERDSLLLDRSVYRERANRTEIR